VAATFHSPSSSSILLTFAAAKAAERDWPARAAARDRSSFAVTLSPNLVSSFAVELLIRDGNGSCDRSSFAAELLIRDGNGS